MLSRAEEPYLNQLDIGRRTQSSPTATVQPVRWCPSKSSKTFVVAFDGPPKLQFPILNKSAKRRIFGIAEVNANRRGSYHLKSVFAAPAHNSGI